MLVIWVGVHLHSMRGAHNRPDPGWCSKPGALSLQNRHSVLFWEAGSRSPLRGLSDADSHNAGWTMGFPTLFTICLFLPNYWQIAKFYRFLRTKQIIGIWVFRLARWLTQSLLLRLPQASCRDQIQLGISLLSDFTFSQFDWRWNYWYRVFFLTGPTLKITSFFR